MYWNLQLWCWHVISDCGIMMILLMILYVHVILITTFPIWFIYLYTHFKLPLTTLLSLHSAEIRLGAAAVQDETECGRRGWGADGTPAGPGCGHGTQPAAQPRLGPPCAALLRRPRLPGRRYGHTNITRQSLVFSSPSCWIWYHVLLVSYFV